MDISTGVSCIIGLAYVIAGFVMGRVTVTTNKQSKSPYKAIKKPVKAIKEHKQKVEQAKEIEKYMAIAENIENYDGTGSNQKDIPMV